MKDIYIITGANGHLGSTIIRALRRHLRNHASNIQEVRGLILPGEEPPFKEDRYIHWYYGDVTDISSLSRSLLTPGIPGSLSSTLRESSTLPRHLPPIK